MKMSKAKADRVLREVAKKNNVSVEEVKEEIMIAMRAGMESEDPDVQKRWDEISKNRDEITPEMILSYLVGELQKPHTTH